MSESSKRHSKFLSLIFILKCLSKASVINIILHIEMSIVNLCEKAKADTQTPNPRPGRDIYYKRNGRFDTKDGLFVWDGLSVWLFASDK